MINGQTGAATVALWGQAVKQRYRDNRDGANAKAALPNTPFGPDGLYAAFYPSSLPDDRVKNVAEEGLRKAAFARGFCGRRLWFKRKRLGMELRASVTEPPRLRRRPPEEPAATADHLVALLARADEVTPEAVNTIPAPASPASHRAAAPRPG